MRVLFFGTPEFAAKVLAYLMEHHVNIVGVITKPDRPKGRSGEPVATPVKALVREKYPHLPVLQPEVVSAPEVVDDIQQFQADLFVVVAYGEIVKQHLLDMPKLGCINLHASILPKYRGAAPIQRCLINGETESGVTIMHMAKKMDAGDIIHIVKVPIDINMTYGMLEQQLCRVGSEALLKVIHDFEQGVIIRIPQDHSLATLAPKIELEDCQLDWQRPAQDLHNLVRGVNPFPGAWCLVDWRGAPKRLKILRTEIVRDFDGNPGNIIASDKKSFTVTCGQGALRILELQLEGKKLMLAEDFLKGISLESLKFHLN